MAELVAEMQTVRTYETQRARDELLIKYRDVFKERIFEMASKMWMVYGMEGLCREKRK